MTNRSVNEEVDVMLSNKAQQNISWTFLNDAMAISAKELPKNT